jgi:acyl-CoA reductase-like NAD-dependent aldehyde dehydrogenase
MQIQLVSPVDGRVLAARPAAKPQDLDLIFAQARAAQLDWQSVDLQARCVKIERAVATLEARAEDAAIELAWQMGRPLRFGPGEIARMGERARYMLRVAPTALADIDFADTFSRRRIRKTPLGVVLVVAPWNYPYLTAINSIVPALAAGNAVVLKHSAQTLLVGERMARAFTEAGLPDGLFQVLHADHALTLDAIRHQAIGHVVFTGSVAAGRKVGAIATEAFKTVTLELGGKDPAYVRHDADLDYAAEQLADGAFFNSGQSCCGIERIYVDAELHDRFVDALAAHARTLCLGNPLEQTTSLGPMARASGAALVCQQVAQAVATGARALLPTTSAATNYLGPQVLIDVTHDMAVMRDESFGPVVGVMRVRSDEEAVRRMNDSAYGLTASIWSSDTDRADALGDRLDFGTVFLNRCDYLDPALPWSGRKDTGIGLSLSALAYQTLTRTKGFHLVPRG